MGLLDLPHDFSAPILLYSDNPEADRAFSRDVLEFRAVDTGGGWLIIALPGGEAGTHPSDGERRQLHGGRRFLSSASLIYDNLPALMKSLQAKGVDCSPPRWKIGNQDDVSVAQRRGIGLDFPNALHLKLSASIPQFQTGSMSPA